MDKDAFDELESEWSGWQPMPKPENCRTINGPAESGIYQIKDKESNELILFGIGKKCQKRMKSLYPKPFGTGTRNNEAKRKHVLGNWEKLEYRTMKTKTKKEAKTVEDFLKAKNNHHFNT